MTGPKPRIVVVAGPTGVGKTAVVLDMARRFGGHVISADAMAVYRYMDIGTAKPTPEERLLVPHHMIDVVDPDEPFDAARYAAQAREIAGRLLERGVPVFVAGGTGLYIKALIHGLFSAGRSDPELRESLRQDARENGPAALHARLAALDPEAAGRIHENDAFRIIRALEVIILTGRPLSGLQSGHAFGEKAFDPLFLCLFMERSALYQAIEKRVDRMMDQGLLAEVRGLLEKGYDPGLKSLQSIGYRHMAEVISGRMPLEEAVRLLKRDTRRLAKRQLTWFGSVPEARWVNVADAGGLSPAVAGHLGPAAG